MVEKGQEQLAKEYPCKLCNYTTISKTNLMLHYRQEHPKDKGEEEKPAEVGAEIPLTTEQMELNERVNILSNELSALPGLDNARIKWILKRYKENRILQSDKMALSSFLEKFTPRQARDMLPFLLNALFSEEQKSPIFFNQQDSKTQLFQPGARGEPARPPENPILQTLTVLGQLGVIQKPGQQEQRHDGISKEEVSELLARQGQMFEQKMKEQRLQDANKGLMEKLMSLETDIKATRSGMDSQTQLQMKGLEIFESGMKDGTIGRNLRDGLAAGVGMITNRAKEEAVQYNKTHPVQGYSEMELLAMERNLNRVAQEREQQQQPAEPPAPLKAEPTTPAIKIFDGTMADSPPGDREEIGALEKSMRDNPGPDKIDLLEVALPKSEVVEE